eukprot:Skav203945  [mRNA]  locus=scaffold391:160516:163171:- [translate_table: standard]
MCHIALQHAMNSIWLEVPATALLYQNPCSIMRFFGIPLAASAAFVFSAAWNSAGEDSQSCVSDVSCPSDAIAHLQTLGGRTRGLGNSWRWLHDILFARSLSISWRFNPLMTARVEKKELATSQREKRRADHRKHEKVKAEKVEKPGRKGRR